MAYGEEEGGRTTQGTWIPDRVGNDKITAEGRQTLRPFGCAQGKLFAQGHKDTAV